MNETIQRYTETKTGVPRFLYELTISAGDGRTVHIQAAHDNLFSDEINEHARRSTTENPPYLAVNMKDDEFVGASRIGEMTLRSLLLKAEENGLAISGLLPRV